MRNGDRISGELVDLSVRLGFMIRVNGQERRIDQNDVAAIELTGVRQLDSDLQAKLSAGRQFIVLRNGEVIDGRLIDIGGSYPKILTVETPSGPRDFSSLDVTQVYYTKPPDSAVAATDTVPAPRTVLAPGAVRVEANQQWVDTGVVVKKGQRVTFNTTGQILFGQGPGMVAGPDGNDTLRGNYPVPAMPVGGLIGKVGNSAPFAIGSNSQPIQMPANGMLMLGVNDTEHGDNSDFFSVVVTRVR